MKELYTKPESIIDEFKTTDSILTASDSGIENLPGGGDTNLGA